jgi:hypothetical protein
MFPIFYLESFGSGLVDLDAPLALSPTAVAATFRAF